MDLSEYCRDIEAHLCRKNDGHLMRIVGPSFEIVAKWAADGVPLKVALGGIDRYFERYSRKGPRKRPVKIDFCEADVLDVFDEWRRATGLTASAVGAVSSDTDAAATPAPPRRKGPSLPEHLERVLVKLSSLRATGVLGDEADALVDRVSAELDAARGKAAGVRGEERRATVERLAALDVELIALVRGAVTKEFIDALRKEASEELAAFRATMAPEAFAAALDRAITRLMRERLGLPVISFS